MSSICAVSALTLNGTNNTNNKSNTNGNHSNESQDIINSLKLIKEKIEVNGNRGDNRTDNQVLNNKLFNNGFNGIHTSNLKNQSNKKSLQIDITRENSDAVNGSQSDGYSAASTLSSSPLSSPEEQPYDAINRSILEQKFSKLELRCDSPLIQINGNDGFDDDSEDGIDEIRAPLLRSISLKTRQTPPGTPHRKKIVRFADSLGLDLESVRHIVTDDLPVVPLSAFGGLKLNEVSGATNGAIGVTHMPWFMQKPCKNVAQNNRPNLVLEFIQPGSLLNFIDRVRNNKVCLENCLVSNTAGNLSITCIIRVLNVSFSKSVTLRYTSNEWLTHNEALASYIPNSCDGFSDKFSVTFSISAGGYYLSPGQRVLFALKYTANTEEYWDNNMGLNYSLIYRV